MSFRLVIMFMVDLAISVEFFGANTLDDDPFVVMPWYKKGNVRDYLRDNPSCSRLKIVMSLLADVLLTNSH